ncbi:IS5 family transposase [Massilia sp. CCM 9210]|uniref:IS5 family transposase n=1 Tax=Massilia scottii TaxID=3057166 RepID=UPI002796E08F|nr:IS5 family transposase [Massilia sp. CCM 9210]MDQ1813457.1 IS5 family transposase [Massilia sp. CCM 9210]
MQKSFSDLEYAAKKKLTRRDVFLAKIDSVTPWSQLHKLIEPFYPKVEGAGRPPMMHQSKKGNDWHFGLKAHIGVDAASGLVHTVIGTAGNVSDVTQAHALLHGDEVAAMGDAGYQGVEKREENPGKDVTWHVAMKRTKRKALPKNKLGRMTEKLEHLKASVRAKVEHPFHVVKNLFRHRKARYRGLEKNTAQLFTLFGFANLMLAGRQFRRAGRMDCM